MSCVLLLAASLTLSLQEPGDGQAPAGGDRIPTTEERERPDVPAADEGLSSAEPGPIALPAIDHPLTLAEIEQVLITLASAHPDLVSLETIGTSRAGRPIQVLTLSDPAGGPAHEKPALLLVDFRAAGRTLGAEACLGFAIRVLDQMGTDPEMGRLLAEHTLYLAPALSPDARVAEPDVRPVLFDRNFPLGWRPASLRQGSGDYPLSEPETLAVAHFFADHPNLVLVAGPLEPDQAVGQPWQGSELPEDDHEAFWRLCAERDDVEPELRPWNELSSPGGGLFDYAYQALGVYPVAWGPPSRPDDPEALSSWVEGVAARVADLMRFLPTVRIEDDGLTEIAPGLWQLDVAIRNAGSVPTLSALGGRRKVNGDLRLTLQGARVLATARRAAEDSTFRTARLHGEGGLGLGVGVLAGGETHWLRVILEGETGSVLEVTGVAARGGRAELAVTLP